MSKWMRRWASGKPYRRGCTRHLDGVIGCLLTRQTDDNDSRKRSAITRNGRHLSDLRYRAIDRNDEVIQRPWAPSSRGAHLHQHGGDKVQFSAQHSGVDAQLWASLVATHARQQPTH
ncbi:hypothetical protein PTT_08874 [Pyrenophora teres f. teres 0-1]|uniref:Uncharacterized protein n=1 Tax=Pyrenophora teres f. teres (strain 0-1) TaxID=861557 RepID=E3RKT2_PYRTT|nr:hypothetical protein PTT_08874 [Pyrenophora teres f. teres 0-1]